MCLATTKRCDKMPVPLSTPKARAMGQPRSLKFMERFIDAAVEQFARSHTEPESNLYVRLREETYRVMQSPQMQIDIIEGRFLQMLVRLSGAKTILELGMFTGYSTLMMAEALPHDGRLITCEIDPKAEAIARRYFAESPHGNKITIRMGPALDTIKE